MADIAKFVEEIKSMTVLELNELVKAIEEEFGVSAAAPVMVAGAGAAAPAAEEKTEFEDVYKRQTLRRLFPPCGRGGRCTATSARPSIF